MPTTAPGAPAVAQRARRGDALRSRLTRIEAGGPPADAALDAVALAIVDAVLDDDEQTLREALPALRGARHALARAEGADAGRQRATGALSALAGVVSWALERLPGAQTRDAVAPGTQGFAFLALLADGEPVASARVREALGVDETQVSRAGRRLLDAGLVARRKLGRTVSWELTPRGRRALQLAGHAATAPAGALGLPRRALGPGEPGADVQWWLDAMRGGAPSADETGLGGDPERARVLSAAMALHEEQGVLATSWEDIAGRAGVDVATVSRWFPAVEDLVPACGGIKLRGLGIPSPAGTAERFADFSVPARVRRLVEELFAIYERGEVSFTVVPREAERLPVLARSHEAVQRALDEFVAAALPADGRDRRAVAAVRALAGFTVWSALRRRGIAGEDAVSVVAAAVGAAVDVTAPARP